MHLFYDVLIDLTHWDRVKHIMRQYNNHHWIREWLDAGFNRNSDIFIKKIHLKMSSDKWQPFCLGLNVLTAFIWKWLQLYICVYILLPSLRYNMVGVITLRPRQNGHHFADDTFKLIFVNENVWISITISLKFVPKGPINNIPALVQIMAWRRSDDKPLSEPNDAYSTDAYMRHSTLMS